MADDKSSVFISVKAETPKVPNFVRASVAGNNITVDVKDLSDNELQRLGEQWQKDLLANAVKRRFNDA